MIAKSRNRQLGQILLDAGILSPLQLDHALKTTKLWGVKLGHALVQLGYIREDILVETLVLQLEMPRVMLSEYAIPDRLLRIFPITVMTEFRFLPFAQKEDSLFIAVSEPFDDETKNHLHEMCRLTLSQALTTESELRSTFRIYFGE